MKSQLGIFEKALLENASDNQDRPDNMNHQDISTLHENCDERRAPAILVFERERSPLCVSDRNRDESGRLTNIRLELISNLSFCGFRIDVTFNATSNAKVNIRNWPFDGITCHHRVLFRVRWAYRNFSSRQDGRARSIMFRAAPWNPLALDLVNQPLQCICFEQVGDEYPFIFKEEGPPCPEHMKCPFRNILSDLISGESFRFFLRKEDSANLNFERWTRTSDIAGWVNDPCRECDELPETTVRQWTNNVQTSMTPGLADLANDVFYGGVLEDDLTTLINRPLAWSLKQFLINRYKDIEPEPKGKIYPVFLNVRRGKFNDETFTNEDNAAVCLVLVGDLFRASVLSGADVGIVTVYGGQVQTYERALALLNSSNPGCGYADVKVGTVEWWSTRTAEVVIFDMVGLGMDRTPKDQYLAQRVRLQIALTTHRQGLVIIGKSHYGPDNVKSLRENSGQTCWDQTLKQVFLWLMDASRSSTIGLTPYLFAVGPKPPSPSSQSPKTAVQEQEMSSGPSKKRARIDSIGEQHDGFTNGTDSYQSSKARKVSGEKLDLTKEMKE